MIGLRQLVRQPMAWVLAAALLAAILLFRDYGQTWDEPLFYKYADALGYAYTPTNWISGHFDLNQAYGPSPDDHKTHGPGYLLLGHYPTRLIQLTGISGLESWHLVNALTFVVGVFFVYGLSRRVAGRGAAAIGAALFATQPLLWGHAFINPKDVPFMVFFAGAVWSGWQMVEQLAPEGRPRGWKSLRSMLLPAVLLGLASSSRVLGPLSALLVVGYWAAQGLSLRDIKWMLIYISLGAGVMLATWPYLWENPLNFVHAFGLMAQNPTVLPVLFAGRIFPADQLPLKYLPFFLTATVTEPVWPLFALGVMGRARRAPRAGTRGAVVPLLLAWLFIPLGYVLAIRPPMYDGMRHFLFMLPPAFIFAAAGLDILFAAFRGVWFRVVLAVAVLLAGLINIALLHPYEYTYYNSLTKGTGGAFRQYETDYWLTCYKEAVEALQATVPGPLRLFVHREAAVAAPYAASATSIEAERDHRQEIQSGDYILVNTRASEDIRTFRGAPEVLHVGRLGATFCVIKRMP